jgi:hypothetical protein
MGRTHKRRHKRKTYFDPGKGRNVVIRGTFAAASLKQAHGGGEFVRLEHVIRGTLAAAPFEA